jgi:hypothetical protein
METTPANETVTKKAPAKRAPARKTATKKATAKKATAKKVAAPKVVTTRVAAATAPVAAATAVASDQFGMMMLLARDIVDTSIGIPFVLQARLSDTPSFDLETFKSFVDDAVGRLGSAPSVDLDAIKAFLDEAKREGHSRVVAVQVTLEPVVSNAALLPVQLTELIETGRAKLRTLIAA